MWLLKFFHFYYFPVEYILYSWIRKYKFNILSEFLRNRKIDAVKPNVTGVFFKFTSTPDFTLAYIDILNYK